jgi:ribonuclease HI
MNVEAFTDGACRGNPGPGAWAFILIRDGVRIWSESGKVEYSTNNVMEYTAIIKALRQCKKLDATEVKLYSDSELVVRQITGVYLVKKPHLKILYEDVQSLRKLFFRSMFKNVPREHKMISIVDAMCNDVLNR